MHSLLTNKPIFNVYLLTFLLFWVSSFVSAEQLSFSKIDTGDGYQFNYRWLDINKAEQSLSFTLPKKGLFSPFRQFREYKPEFAERYIQRQLRKSLREKPIKGVAINFDPSNNSAQLTSPDKEALTKAQMRIQEDEQQFFLDYLESQFYHQFTSHDFIRGIKPDHGRIATASIEVLTPTKDVILDTVNFRNIRLVTNYVLSFVQAIPYSTLESRVTSSGAGFNVPAKVLWENQGDCDSKMTLTAALLRTLMPRVGMVLVYIDQHAFIGLDVIPEGDDITINHDGRTFVLGDPTGPLPMNLGTISFDSEQAIKAGLYSAETFE